MLPLVDHSAPDTKTFVQRFGKIPTDRDPNSEVSLNCTAVHATGSSQGDPRVAVVEGGKIREVKMSPIKSSRIHCRATAPCSSPTSASLWSGLGSAAAGVFGTSAQLGRV